MILDPKHPVTSFMDQHPALTVRELAEKLGTSTQAVHYYRNSGDKVKLSTLRAVAKAYGKVVKFSVGKKAKRPDKTRGSQ